jgi:hypothetical protein
MTIRAAIVLIATCFACSAHATDGCAGPFPSDDRSSGYSWLEAEQEKVFLPSHRTCETLKRESNERLEWGIDLRVGPNPGIADDIRRQLSVPLPTRYELPEAYAILFRTAKRIEETVHKRTSGQFPRVLWGTLPVLSVNAGALKYQKDYVVYLNHQLLIFGLSALAMIDRTIVVTELEGGHARISSGPKVFTETIKRNPAFAETFASLVVAFAKGIDIPKLEVVNPEIIPIWYEQTAASHLFLVGHEYGHVLGKDPDIPGAFAHARWASAHTEVPMITRDWAKELKADVAGYELAKASNFSMYRPDPAKPMFFRTIARYAPVLLLHLYDVLEDAMYCGGSGKGSLAKLSYAERSLIVRAAKAATSFDNVPPTKIQRLLGCRFGDHPPAWVRATILSETAERLLEADLVGDNKSDVDVAISLIENVALLRRVVASQIRKSCAKNPPCGSI